MGILSAEAEALTHYVLHQERPNTPAKEKSIPNSRYFYWPFNDLNILWEC